MRPSGVIAALTSLAALAACVARLPVDGAACPCPNGYCCVGGTCTPMTSAHCQAQEPHDAPTVPTGRDGGGGGHHDGAEGRDLDVVDREVSAVVEAGRADVAEAGRTDVAEASAPDADGPLSAPDADAGNYGTDPCVVLPVVCSDPPAPGDACNPVCNTGCAPCNRCTIKNGRPICLPNLGRAGPGDLCTPTAASGRLIDECAEGSLCVRESCGVSRCHRLCQDDTQCERGACDVVVTDDSGAPTRFRACPAPPRACDAVADTGCPSNALGCYLTDAGTVCECPTAAGPAQSACAIFSDCFVGLTCLAGAVSSTCEEVCDTIGNRSCFVGTCQVTTTSSRYGVCIGP
jgi:hypothetical protein